MMLHQDGSRHVWLDGQPALDLIVTLDDAGHGSDLFGVSGRGGRHGFARAADEPLYGPGGRITSTPPRGSKINHSRRDKWAAH